MKKFIYLKALLFSFSVLQLLFYCPLTWANKLQALGGMLLVKTESEESGGKSNSVNSLIDKGNQQESLGNFAKASAYFDTALNMARTQDDEKTLNFLLSKKGTKFLRADELDSALVYLLSVEDYAIKNNIDTLLADVRLNLGLLANKEGRRQECVDYYNSALHLYKKNYDTAAMAGVMNNFSLYYSAIGDYDKALECSILNIQYRSIHKETYQYVNSIITLGNIYEKLEEYDTALAKYNEAYQLSNQYGYSHLTNTALIDRAIIYFRHQKFTEAASEFKRAIDVAQENNNKQLEAKLYSNLGVVYRNQDKIELALESYRKALQLGEIINDEARIEAVYLNMGFLYKENKNYKEAIHFYNLSLPIAVKLQEKVDIQDIYQNLSLIYGETGEYKKAYSYLTLATQYQDSIINKEKVRAIEDMKAKYEKERNVAQIKSLQDENRIAELEKKSIQTERNAAIGISLIVVFLLMLILYFFRMRVRKNRIIAFQRIQQLEDEKKLLAAQSVIVGQENERKRIAQELHDGIGVLLSTASIHFSTVSKKSKDSKTTEIFDKAEQLLKQAGGEVRKISQNMMPVVLSKFGLFEALEDMFDQLDEMKDMHVNTSFSGSKTRLTENLEIMLYRIVQEMVNNTLKHAKAKNIEFSFSKGNGVILIDFKDDGVGFDFDKLPHNSSLGIFGIQSRVDFLKGKLAIESKVGIGTYYHISVPLNNHKS